MKWSSGVRRWDQPIEHVETVNADEIDAEAFRTEFLNKCRPLIIRSATEHWPAASRWREPDYLAGALGEQKFVVHRVPVIEMNWRKRQWPERFAAAFESQQTSIVSYDELMELADSNEAVFSYAVGIDDTSNLAAIRNDIGTFPFVPKPAPTHYYKPLRAFVHGISYTDWHYHPDDETLMCQFGRSKTVHMLPPAQSTWDVFFEIAAQEERLGTADPDRWPRLKTLRPYVAEVHPGDAVYIPSNWWHAVECVEETDQLGITVAYCWGSPLHIRVDPRFPFHRFSLRHGKLKHRIQLAGAYLAWAAFGLVGKTLKKIPGPAS